MARGLCGKEQVAVIYGEPETIRFLEAVRRLSSRSARFGKPSQAKQRVRSVLRKIRAG